jgi:hypothetical protein
MFLSNLNYVLKRNTYELSNLNNQCQENNRQNLIEFDENVTTSVLNPFYVRKTKIFI